MSLHSRAKQPHEQKPVVQRQSTKKRITPSLPGGSFRKWSKIKTVDFEVIRMKYSVCKHPLHSWNLSEFAPNMSQQGIAFLDRLTFMKHKTPQRPKKLPWWRNQHSISWNLFYTNNRFTELWFALAYHLFAPAYHLSLTHLRKTTLVLLRDTLHYTAKLKERHNFKMEMWES